MSDMKKYVESFFDELEVFEDVARGHCYKIFMRQAIFKFLDDFVSALSVVYLKN